MTLLSELKGEENYPKRLTVKERGKIIFVGIEKIDSIEAQGNYLGLDMGGPTHHDQSEASLPGSQTRPEKNRSHPSLNHR